MKALKTYFLLSLLSFAIAARAGSEDSAAKHHFVQAAESLRAMLEGKEAASYEDAIYILENAWWDGQIDQASFKAAIDHHCGEIKALMEHYRDPAMMDQPGDLLQTSEEKRTIYEKALANFAIYTYMTSYKAFTYAAADPLGTIDWTNTQVSHLLNEGKGNCFALASLFKILSDRLGSDASLCTAPGHIYIRHADDKGIYHNVELSTRSFPGTGTIETLTHTPSEAVKNGIALRELDRQQSLALSLVYLAKGYSRKFGITGDQFMLDCAELALEYDPRNLNAMLLKAEVLEERLLTQQKDIAQLSRQKDFLQYQSWITRVFKLGYREMPFDMKNILVKGWIRDTLIELKTKEHIPSRLKHKTLKDTRYASLSWGLFDEQIRTKPLERYGRTVFDTKQMKIVGFVEEDKLYNSYEFDPVVFAWNVDPLAHLRTWVSPYNFVQNNPINRVDPTGALDRPIYDRDGYLLGTDDEGIRGNALVMDEEDFHQNMPAAEALEKNKGPRALKSEEAKQRFIETDSNLPGRPDWDGYLTLEEANDWYKNGGGKPLYVTLDKLNLSGLYADEFENQQTKQAFSLFTNSGSLNDALVYGSISIILVSDDQIRAFADEYNFEMRNALNPGNWLRNFATVVGGTISGKGVEYDIYFTGFKSIDVTKPKGK